MLNGTSRWRPRSLECCWSWDHLSCWRSWPQRISFGSEWTRPSTSSWARDGLYAPSVPTLTLWIIWFCLLQTFICMICISYVLQEIVLNWNLHSCKIYGSVVTDAKCIGSNQIWSLFYCMYYIVLFCVLVDVKPLVLLHHWSGIMKSIQPVNNWVMRFWCGYLSAVRCRLFHMVQLMPLPSQNPITPCHI